MFGFGRLFGHTEGNWEKEGIFFAGRGLKGGRPYGLEGGVE